MTATLPFDQLGGAERVRELVDRFYDIMDSEPETATIRGLHAESLKSSREKLYLFLTGWLGGPPLYVDKYGPPMLRARHLPFSIGKAERDQWLWAMSRAMDELEIPADFRALIWPKLMVLADHMRNQDEV